MSAMRVIDSHTEGEPTRMIIAGGPDLGSGAMAERREIFRRDFDHVRSFAVDEPRGHEAMVGALLCAPVDKAHAAGLIFFNNVGFLGMCGHATIGAAVTLHHMGRIGLGRHSFETPVGVVSVHLLSRHAVEIENVASDRHLEKVTVAVEGMGQVTGDVAWGGNWFFLTEQAPCALTMANIPELTRKAEAIKRALAQAGITGRDGAEIDHIEIFARPENPSAHSRNFVLCPGSAYDRSPCGTGTSAKLACLAAAGKLQPGEDWVQESIVGSRFAARYRRDDKGRVTPTIPGHAFVVSEATFHADPDDPFLNGFRR